MGSDPLLDNNTGHPIIFFDGVCNLCNGAVQFIIRNDKKGYFHFASLQSTEADQLLTDYGLSASDSNTIILLKEGKVFIKSDAALEISKNLDGAWKILSVFKVFPRFIRDGVYDWVARNRYRWFGKRDECMVPTKNLVSRFLHS